MDITEIKNYDELTTFIGDNDLASPYFCLDAREVPYSAVYAYDTFEEGTVPSCLESWEIMRAVNETRANPIFSDADIEAEKDASIILNSINELPEDIADNFLDSWWRMESQGASTSWLASTFEAVLPLYETKGSFFLFVAGEVERSWTGMKESGFGPSESMAVISALAANDLSGISFWDSRLRNVSEVFRRRDYYRGYPNVPEERIKGIISRCPELLYSGYSLVEQFAGDQVKPLIAAGFSDSQIAEVFKAYKGSPFAMGSIEGMLENLNKLQFSTNDKYEMLMHIAGKFESDQISLVTNDIGSPYNNIEKLNKLCDAKDVKWLIYFCIDHAEGQAGGALTMAAQFAEAGWGASKIAMFIKALPKGTSAPVYESVAQTALDFERMGVPDIDALYFFEEMFKRDLVRDFGYDMKTESPAMVAQLRKRENISYREALDRVIAATSHQ